jgi:hypothetical protein
VKEFKEKFACVENTKNENNIEALPAFDCQESLG